MAEPGKVKRVLIINKFGPDSNAITGKTSKELGDYLANQGIVVDFLCIDSNYKSEKISSLSSSTIQRIYKLRPSYEGKTPVKRLLGSLWDGFRLYLNAASKKVDTVIIMTDPPLLIFWFQLFGLRKRRMIYWTMDIYPEAFSAGGYISQRNLIYKFISFIVYRKKPDLVINLGNQQKKFLQRKFSQLDNTETFPCGIVEHVNLNGKNGTNNSAKIRFGYGGNIGEAHDARFLIELINNLDPLKHEIIISIYGSKADLVLSQTKNNAAVSVKKTLTLDDIASVDVNIATLLPAWNHICVPSKAVTAICCNSALLLNVSNDADAFHMFRRASWVIEPQENYRGSVQQFLGALTKDEIHKKRIEAERIAEELKHGKTDVFSRISNYIMSN